MQRDAIVVSGWTWDAFNVPERIALALVELGARVLYVENPVSVTRPGPPLPRSDPPPEIIVLRPRFFGHRLNYVDLLARTQAQLVANQIRQAARRIHLRRPLFFYPWLGTFVPLAAAMCDYPRVHIHMDYLEPWQERHVASAHLILAIPPAVYHRLKARYPERVELIPQAVDLRVFQDYEMTHGTEPAPLRGISRPRLIFAGGAASRLNIDLLRSVLTRRPDWHFIYFGDAPELDTLPNSHALAWVDRRELPGYLAHADVGLLPYDCYDEQQLHCVPLKAFDYFAAGIPVVSTPLVHLWRYRDVVEFGDTAAEIQTAVERALAQDDAATRRQRRQAVAAEHSIERLAEALERVLAAHID
jgi:glycosyltransferase involved in cell wall biosynthesis